MPRPAVDPSHDDAMKKIIALCKESMASPSAGGNGRITLNTAIFIAGSTIAIVIVVTALVLYVQTRRFKKEQGSFKTSETVQYTPPADNARAEMTMARVKALFQPR